MKFTLKQIADLVKGELIGSPDIVISSISGLKEASEGDISFLSNSKYQGLLKTTAASAIITSREVICKEKALIRTDNPSLAFSKVIELVAESYANHPKGIHPTAVVGDGVELGDNVSLGPNVVVGDKAKIGKNAIIYSGCYIGHCTEIGDNCLIYPNVTIRERIYVGNDVIIHSGVVIGSDGFGFAMVEGVQKKIPQIGTVVIEDGVEIGANAAIDRARFNKTIIGKGTKIDNLVQIAHNVTVGPNCIIVAQVGIAGSTQVGEGVILAGQAGVVGHVTIGEGAVVGANSLIVKDCKPWTVYLGNPARPVRERPRKKLLEMEEDIRKELYTSDGEYIPRSERNA